MISPGLYGREKTPPPSFGKIGWREWIFPLLFAALLMGLVWIPYHDAYSREGAGHKFMGLVGENAIDDNNVYLGLMRQAAEGKSLFTNNFTPESNPPALFNFLYLSLGRLAGWTGWSLDSVHRLFGAVSILLLVLTGYSFIATAIRRPFYRRFALVLACFGGGFLWLNRMMLKTIGFDIRPVTPWLVEINLFHAMIVYPHFIFAAALMTGSLTLLLKSERVRRFGPAVAGGCCAAMLAASHAFEAVAFVPIAAVYLLLDALGLGRLPGSNRLKSAAIVLGLPLSMLIINRWMLMREPIWGDVVARLDFHTPEPFRLIFGLGASFFIAVLTSEGLLCMGRPSGERMAKAWVLTVLFLAYVPYINWRWHLLNGIQIPLAILATQGLRRTIFRRILLRRRARRRRGLPRGLWAPPALAATMTAVMLACCLSAANLFLSYRYEARKVRVPAFLTTGEVSAMSWMDRAVSRDALIFASGMTGNYVPRMSGQRVFLGEDKLTQAFEARERNVREFFSGDWDDAKRMALLKQFRVDYVFYGPDERKLGPYDPARAAFLTPVYDRDGIQIYQVKGEKPAAVRAAAPSAAGGAMP
jgi:hypothetical protein